MEQSKQAKLELLNKHIVAACLYDSGRRDIPGGYWSKISEEEKKVLRKLTSDELSRIRWE